MREAQFPCRYNDNGLGDVLGNCHLHLATRLNWGTTLDACLFATISNVRRNAPDRKTQAQSCDE